VFIEAKDDGDAGDNWTTGAVNRAKLQSNHHHQQTNIQFLQAGCHSCRIGMLSGVHWQNCHWAIPEISVLSVSRIRLTGRRLSLLVEMISDQYILIYLVKV